MVNFNFRGLIAPTFAPFNNDMSINLKIIPEYANMLNKNEIKGVLVNGTTGEGMSLSVKERKLLVEAWVEAAKSTGQHVMAQIGGCPLPDVLELAEHAEKIGVNSLLCLPELYFKPSSSSELTKYLSEVGAKASNTPLLYYHIPSFTHVNINMGEFLNDVVGKIPNFCGIKFTSVMLDEGVAALKANEGKFAVFLGADTILAGAYALGFDSAIATSLNMFPKLNTEILEAIHKNDLVAARNKQELLNSYISQITKDGTWVPTMKTAMNTLSPLNVGSVRSPLLSLNAEQKTRMKNAFKNNYSLQVN